MLPQNKLDELYTALNNVMSTLEQGAGGSLAGAEERIRVTEGRIRYMEPKPDSLLVALYRTKALLLYRKGDREKARIQLRLALALAERDSDPGLYLDIAAGQMWFAQNILGISELTDIVREIAALARGQGGLKTLANHAVGITEMVLSLSHQKRLGMELEEVYELVLNLKGGGASGREKTPGSDWTPLEELKTGLPEKSVLLDFFRFPEALTRERHFREMRYCVFILRRDAGVSPGGLLNASEIRKSLQLITANTGAADTENRRAAVAVVEFERIRLYSQIIKPLEPHIKSAEVLFISPDFDLKKLPFRMLGHRRGSYLYDRFKVVYLDSARQLGSGRGDSGEF